jgi:hypothetical protein
MSLSKMVGLHPDVKGDVNDLLVTAARHSMPCSLFCTSSADACVAETMPPQRPAAIVCTLPTQVAQSLQ